MSARGAVTPSGWMGSVGLSSVSAGFVRSPVSVEGAVLSSGLDVWVLVQLLSESSR